MAIVVHRISLQALLAVLPAYCSASADVSAPIRIGLKWVELHKQADLPGELPGLAKTPGGGAIGVMSSARAQALLARYPERATQELGSVKAPSGEPVVVERMHQQACWNTGLRVAVTATRASSGAVDLVIKSEIIGEEGFKEPGKGRMKPSVRKRNLQKSVEPGQTVLLAFPHHSAVQMVEDKVPILGNLPLLGRFFRSKTECRLRCVTLLVATPSAPNMCFRASLHGGGGREDANPKRQKIAPQKRPPLPHPAWLSPKRPYPPAVP
jgi:hypothetical protein